MKRSEQVFKKHFKGIGFYEHDRVSYAPSIQPCEIIAAMKEAAWIRHKSLSKRIFTDADEIEEYKRFQIWWNAEIPEEDYGSIIRNIR